MKFCIIGGDARILEVARILTEEGQSVSSIGMGPHLPKAESSCGADVILLGLPVSRDHKTVYAPYSETAISYDDLIGLIDKRAQVLCGMPDATLCSRFRTAGIRFTDYFEREELAILNAIPTAEGAVEIAMREMPVTLHGARCLILGFGRIGKYLAKILHGMGAHVTVSARRASDLAWIEALGWNAVETALSKHAAGAADVIFNTVPAPILDSSFLGNVRQKTPIIDLAAIPGGADAATIAALNLRVLCAPGLPGKVAPVTAGNAIYRTVQNILLEKKV